MIGILLNLDILPVLAIGGHSIFRFILLGSTKNRLQDRACKLRAYEKNYRVQKGQQKYTYKQNGESNACLIVSRHI
jgi:hypothetical protein